MDIRDAVHGMEYEMYTTVVVDIDGVVANFQDCSNDCNYNDYPSNAHALQRDQCPVMEKARKALKALKLAGLRVILWTGRIEEERGVTKRWLKDNDLPYDSLWMGKPRGVIYIDDFGYRFQNWDDTMEFIADVVVEFGCKIKHYYKRIDDDGKIRDHQSKVESWTSSDR